MRFAAGSDLVRRSDSELGALAAVDKAINGDCNMVVSLPTSAGKARVAELCILRALAKGDRVVFVVLLLEAPP